MLVSANIHKEAYKVLGKSLSYGISAAIKRFPSDIKIAGGIVADSIPEQTYFIENCAKLGYNISMQHVKSFADSLLIANNIESKALLVMVHPITGKALHPKDETYTSSFLEFAKSKIVPTKTDLSEGVQLVLANPYWALFKRMWLLMVATVLIMIMVIGCIVYQIKIIALQNRIACLREDFSYAMIHDMKTPLTSIMACISLLRSGRVEHKPELKDKYFGIVKDEAEHLLSLANKVLTLSKLENRKLAMAKETLVLEPMVADLIETFTAKATKPIHFSTDLQASQLYADEEFLKEVLCNLIDNAIKYSGNSVDIKISTRSTDQHTLVKVRDNGIGISEKDFKLIFDKFERAAAFRKSGQERVAGFGLGLNFVYQIMKAHEGWVTVDSRLGVFSEFTLYIPLTLNTEKL